MTAKKVVVLGGGVAGLSAAHELVRRGYRVEVYEARSEVGGKASSQFVDGTATGGRESLPGEHGFRFYPSFYKHLIRTMQEIPLPPFDPERRVVADNLFACTEAGVAPIDPPGLRRFLRRAPRTVLDVADMLNMYFKDVGVGLGDAARFGQKVLRYFASCRARRDVEYERISWWDYLDGDRYDPRFQRYLRAVPRIMVAMNPRRGSARTIGDISMQLLEDYASEGVNHDRTLIGPTSEAWIAPWRAYLERCGVRFHVRRPLAGLEFDEVAGRVTGARIEALPEPVRADFFVAAMPLEVAAGIVTNAMARYDPDSAKLREIHDRRLADSSKVLREDEMKMTDWMVGIQFFLHEDVPLVPGHVFYPDSPWALSSISQAQFWNQPNKRLFRDCFGDGTVGGVLSVDISDWNREGTFVKKPAKRCTREEIKTEVWEQLKAGLNKPESTVLRDDFLARWHLDREIEFVGGRPPVNHAPLLVDPPMSWDLRPTAELRVENLVLASDYVRTHTILACMEGANEAARRAVNAILARDGGGPSPCPIWPLRESPMFDAAKALDAIAYARRDRGPAPELTELWTMRPPADLDAIRRLQGQVTALSMPPGAPPDAG